ncbi:hypothetical protein [Dyadobacter frigoris]|uniref:Uncharacterized protein n=1 Tax=Dyadobacter frigoris TaxID=2576211 RepID=A0A4U6D6N5_9BACT|nr:hypothetical protein [Dyadobacter frigoris]TKT91788.1 hypothetical protein FDK13_11550 [Dyadobacter frigoris]GLU55564.1 hypothetical protein Dfri01_50250 [Dyadobacter frigoris]
MRTKAILALDLLEQELELLTDNQQWCILGGDREYWNASNGVSYYRDSSNDPWTACDNLNEVTIRSGNSYNAGNTSNGYYNPQNGSTAGGGYSEGSSSASLSSNGYLNNSPNGYNSSNGNVNGLTPFLDLQDQVSFAISHGLAWKETYSVANLAFAGRLNTATVLNNIVTLDVLGDLNLENLKGVGIVNAAGKVLGISSAAFAVGTLVADLNDGDRSASALHWADAGISVGSLFLKSNLVGFAVSGSWLLIKGEFE